jgi:hypothetical protein
MFRRLIIGFLDIYCSVGGELVLTLLWCVGKDERHGNENFD